MTQGIERAWLTTGILLEIGFRERSVELKTQALKCISALLKFRQEDEILRLAVAELFMKRLEALVDRHSQWSGDDGAGIHLGLSIDLQHLDAVVLSKSHILMTHILEIGWT